MIRQIQISKNAQSEVVTTVLLVLIGITAVVLVGGFVINIVRDRLQTTDCFKTQGQLVLNLGTYTYFNSTSKILYITIERGNNDFNLTGIVVSTGTEEISKAITISQGSAGNLATTGVAMYNNGLLTTALTVPSPNEKTTYALNLSKVSLTSVNEASISPVLKTGGVCEQSDKRTIPSFA